MSGDLDLEQRYRRVLRLLPGYYRDKWEEDMVAAFLDSAATAVVTTAYDSRGGVDFSVAGRTWALPMVFRPFRSQQLSVALPSKNQALQLHRLLVSSG